MPPALLVLEGALPREPTTVEEWRALWARFGVSCDSLSCTVLTLGLRVRISARGYLPARLRAAARAGKPIVLTLAELRAEPPRLAGEVLFVCENPSIVAAAAAELGAECPPLLCTSGWPNTAVAAVLEAAVAAGMWILVHADGDPAGAAIAARVLQRASTRAWRSLDPCARIHEEALLAELLDLDGPVGQAGPLQAAWSRVARRSRRLLGKRDRGARAWLPASQETRSVGS